MGLELNGSTRDIIVYYIFFSLSEVEGVIMFFQGSSVLEPDVYGRGTEMSGLIAVIKLVYDCCRS